MATFLRRLPAILSFLVLGAHFLRGWNLAAVAACVALVPILFVRRRWAWAASVVALVLGSCLWAWTAWRIAQFRMAEGKPFFRMLVILGGVGLFTLVSAVLLPRNYARRTKVS